MSSMHARSITEEYLRLGPLQTRISVHQRYSEIVHDVELDVITAAGIAGGDDLLDVGCGTGSFLRRLRTEGLAARLDGLDASPAAVAAAAEVTGVNAMLGDAMALPYGDAEFDVVTLRHMLYHVDGPIDAIREARRVLRVGGRFAAVVNVPDSTPHIAGLVREQVVSQGIEPPLLPNSTVHAGNLPDMVRSVFGNVTVIRSDNALVFPDPQGAIKYGLAIMNFYGVADDSPEREAVATGIVAAVEARFAESVGQWRDPKGYVVCLADRFRSDGMPAPINASGSPRMWC